MSKSARTRAAEARQKALEDHFRANGAICVNGRELKPGSREYERELKKFLRSLGPEELVSLLRKSPHT